MRLKYLMVLAIVGLFCQNSNAQGCAEASSDGVNVFGFIQPQYEFDMTDPSVSSFTFERARVGVMGNIPYDVSYYVVTEMSPFINPDSPYDFLLDAFVSYSGIKWAKMSMGSFKAPFGLETGTACSKLHTVYRSKATLELVSPFRDLGFQVLGGNRDSLFQYAIGLMNGTGLKVEDTNHFKDIVGRVGINPTPWLHVGGSFKYGQATSAAGLPDPDERLRIGGELELNFSRFLIQGEYIYAKDKGSSIVGGGCSGGGEPVIGDKLRQGGFIQGIYNATYNLQGVVKAEFYDADMNIGNNEEFVLTAGINYFLNDWTRLQVNYMYAAEMPIDTPNDKLVIQLQVQF